MKIVFLSRYQKTVERGAENFVTELSQKLSENNQVEVLSGTDSDSLNKILREKYDVVIPMNGRLQALKASLGRLRRGYKLLITGQSGIGRDDIWNIFIKPDIFVALTDYQRMWAEHWTWGSKLVKIPNGVDLKKFTPSGNKINLKLERPIILSVGVLTWYKYHDRLIQAAKLLRSGSVLIVGQGPDKERLQQLGRKLLGDRFAILNFSYQDMPKLYRSVDLFTLPSWDREAFGIVYLEAMASGLGVVAPDDLSRHEIVGNGGLFVDVSDSQKYAKVIDEALKTDWSKKARSQAEKFSWDKIAKEYEKIMLDLVAK